MKIFMFNYWNDLALDSEETYFLEVSAHVSLKQATAGVWECCFCLIWLKNHNFLNIKTGEKDLKIVMFNNWNDLG